jgi:enoyl-CoA hydratase/carnithine racemase
MARGYVTIESHGDVALVRVDRPPANALDLDLLEQSRAVLDDLERSEPAAVVVVGRDGFFSAGVDLKATPKLDAEGQRSMVIGVNRLIGGWYCFLRPVVCAVNGHAIAGGLIFALCGDVRICSTKGKLGLTELRAGIPYPAAAMAVVRAELTPAVARRLVLQAELIDPPAALEMGVVDELAGPGDVLPRALEVAGGLAQLPGGAYKRIKQQLRGETISQVTRVVADGDDPMIDAWLSGESAGAAAAILEK